MLLIELRICTWIFLGESMRTHFSQLKNNGFTGSSASKEFTCNVGDLGLISESEDPLEKEIATHSSILAWRIPWTEDPGVLQSTGSERVRQNWANNTFTFTDFNRAEQFSELSEVLFLGVIIFKFLFLRLINFSLTWYNNEWGESQRGV